MLLLLLTAQDKVVGFIDLTGEVLAVCKQVLEIDTRIIVQKHTGDSWSVIFPKSCLDMSINTISNKFVLGLSLEGAELAYVNWGQLNELHLRLSNWLLLLHLLLHLLWIYLSWYWWLRHVHRLLGLVAILLLLALLLIWILLLVHLVLTLFIAASVLTSSTTLLASSTPVVIFVSSVVISHILLIHVALSRLHWLHLLHLVDIPVLILLQVNELEDVIY